MTTAYDTQVGGDHYKGMAIQPMQFSMANGLDACTHTAIKYLVRKKGEKNKRAEDLRKAIHCIQLLAQHEGIDLGEAVQPSAVPYIGPDRRKTTCKDHLPVGDADADGWIKWEGGECPVPYGTRIDVEYRGGARARDIRALVRKLTGHAATHWEHINGSSDIVAYRLSKEASHAEEVLRAIAEIDAQDVSYIGPDRRACGNDLYDMVRAGKSVLPEDAGACGNVGREA